MSDAAGSQRRRQFFLGMMLSTVLAGFFAIFLCLWRVVPHWWVGQWSLRTQYALTQSSSLEALLKDYHRVLDNGGCHIVDARLIARLRAAEVLPEERDAILRFCCLRVARSRATPELFELGPEWIGPVFEATIGAESEVRSGAVFLMAGLRRGRGLYKPMIRVDREGPAAELNHHEVILRLHEAFLAWWSLPPDQRSKAGPSVDGVEIVEP